jgi:hypothetical protein
MAGPSIRALLEVELNAARLVEADALLESVASKLVRTGRGRVWDIWIVVQDGEATERPYSISIERIGALQEEDLELLARGQRSLDSVKERLSISSGLNSKIDYAQIEMLAQRFVSEFGGVSGVPIK